MSDNSKAEKIQKKINSKFLLKLFAIIVVVFCIMIFCFNKFFLYNGKIARNITIESVEVTNLTKSEARKLIDSKFKPQQLNMSYDNKDYVVEPSDIDLKYDISGAVTQAYDLTRKGNYIEDVKIYLGTLFKGKNIEIAKSFDEAKLSNKVTEISDSINVKMENAKVVIDGGITYKDPIVGKEFDVAENKESIYKMIKNMDKKTLNLKVNLVQPEITLQQVQAVNSTLGSYTTYYGSSPDGRRYNVGLAARKASDILLMPGEEFSYNKYTGPSNKANGYKNAPVIVYGAIKQAPGGGVCQTSSTMYNAALFAGMEITEVNNHTAASTYVPKGRDATVSDGGLNLRFKNPYNHPIYIKNYADGSNVTSIIYGSSEDKQKVSIEVKYSGGVYRTYRKYLDDKGNVTKKEFISAAEYKKLKTNN
ncbi:MAG: VanW family protein [Clostridioides sp.]|jgi:vancomycin resistance protein YoaR|nr:VanW family protein [Clostridioides sp.]